jgi:oligosaccharyltransferase complex subunit alpha (ribophorin I)
MERLIEVSMWGNIAIEETIDMHHAGAKLRGSFSRYEFQRENSGVSSVKSFKTLLPAAATDVYYRDDIGNISTSALRSLDEAVEVELRPRFPLFGGWKTHYTLGYNVPSYEYLFQKGDQFALSMRFIDHIHDDMLVEELIVKVILPEGAKVRLRCDSNVIELSTLSVQVGKLSIPYPTTRLSDELHYTYLDYHGRPIVTLQNVGYLTEKHIQDFQLEFTYPRLGERKLSLYSAKFQIRHDSRACTPDDGLLHLLFPHNYLC